MKISNGHLKTLLDLYLNGFDKRKGTLLFISGQLGEMSGHHRNFLASLVKEGALVHDGWDNINGKVCKVYRVDKEALLEILKKDETFKRVMAIAFDNWDGFDFDFPVFNGKELKEMIQ